jgi:large subunit ribosomal protein L17
MRHGKKDNHLGRTKSHRDAMLSNMASSLLLNKRITTTVAKAKELRKYVEPLITKAKTDTTHSRRVVFSYLQNKESIQSLFGEVATRTAERPGGYTRIIKLGDARLGDNAEMCMMELVDFNDIYKKDGAEKKGKTRRSRKSGKKADVGVEDAAASEATEKEPKAKAPAKEPKAKKEEKSKEKSPKKKKD